MQCGHFPFCETFGYGIVVVRYFLPSSNESTIDSMADSILSPAQQKSLNDEKVRPTSAVFQIYFRKIKMRIANERYLRSHPEIKAMMSEFTKYNCRSNNNLTSLKSGSVATSRRHQKVCQWYSNSLFPALTLEEFFTDPSLKEKLDQI